MKHRKPWEHKLLPHEPVDWDEDVAYAVRALQAGVANDGQQKLAWSWLIYVSGVDDWAYRPDSAGTGARDVVLGKQFVGHSFRKMLSEEVTMFLNRKRAEETAKAAPATRVAPINPPIKPKRQRKRR